MLQIIIAVLLLASPGLVAAQSSTIRIDQFDQHGRRQGYLILDQKTGRVDSFDNRSNRTGYGTLTPSSPATGPSPETFYDRDGRPVSVERRWR